MNVLKKYNIRTVEQKATDGRILKYFEAPDFTDAGILSLHFFREKWIVHLQNVLNEVTNALNGQPYHGWQEFGESVVVFDHNTATIEDDVKIPTQDYKELLEAWINFLQS